SPDVHAASLRCAAREASPGGRLPSCAARGRASSPGITSRIERRNMRQQSRFTALGRLGACVVVGGGLPVALAAPPSLVGVPAANPRVAAVSVPNVLTPELRETIAAQGSMRLENGTADFPFYGYDGDGTLVPLAGALQAPGHNVEATKTEPDKNTYLVLQG